MTEPTIYVLTYQSRNAKSTEGISYSSCGVDEIADRSLKPV